MLTLTVTVEGISFKMGSLYVSVPAVDMDFPACGGFSPLIANPCPAWPVKPFLGDMGPATDCKCWENSFSTLQSGSGSYLRNTARPGDLLKQY